MKRFIEGVDRSQSVLLPECLDDFVSKDNPVRVIDVFVEETNLLELGFDRMQAASTGRPGYCPTVLLKIYIYGYLNRIQSSRRLERECQRNLEVMWLTGRLTPDFKTIADFRKDNAAAIQQLCSRFVLLCRQAGLFSEAIVAIDGSKLKAVNNRDKNFTEHKLKVRLEHLHKSVGHYLADLDRADRQGGTLPEVRITHLKDKIETIRAEIGRLNQIGEQMKASPDGQISLTDPDARSMVSAGRGTGLVGYNVQTAVDTQHHMIVAHEVTNVGTDRNLLYPMAERARQAMGANELTALADRGYFNGVQILDCEQQGIRAMVPKPLTSNSKFEGRFDKRDFVYHAESDEYCCPAGQTAKYRFTSVEQGLTIHRYWSSACPQCPLKRQCTPSDYRRISRWEHEAVLETMQKRLNEAPETARLRRQTAEHPFGTFKLWMGATHFLTKTLHKVRTEMSLHVLAYNLKRAMKILGIEPLMKLMQA